MRQQKANILLVEDEDDARSLYGFMLAKAGYRVRATKNGLEGFTEVQIERPNVILTDIAMPVFSGLELIKAVKANEEFSSIPIIAMTSFSKDFQRLAKEAGASATVDKSIEEAPCVKS
jgi:two-component system cell cycle response regulator DivK